MVKFLYLSPLDQIPKKLEPLGFSISNFPKKNVLDGFPSIKQELSSYQLLTS